MYRWGWHGASSARKPIMWTEGFWCNTACGDLGHLWYKKLVPFGLDNKPFQASVCAGRSKALEMNELVRTSFVQQVKGHFILDAFWLSSAENELADHLSRNREDLFLVRAYESGFWPTGLQPVRHPLTGDRVTAGDWGGQTALSMLRMLEEALVPLRSGFNSVRNIPKGTVMDLRIAARRIRAPQAYSSSLIL